MEKNNILDHLLNGEDKQELKGTALEDLGFMIGEMDRLEGEIADLEEQLKAKKKEFLRLSGEDIPEFLRTNGMSEIKLTDGRKVSYKDDLSASVKDIGAFASWLEARGEGDIVKFTLSMDHATYQKIEDKLEGLPVNKKQAIHPQTLNKYIRELPDVQALDNMVNVYHFSKTKIK